MKKVILTWAPFAACVVFGILAVSLHHIVTPGESWVVYLQVPACTLIPLIFPALRRWARICVPYFFEVIVAVQIIVAVDLGTALGVYFMIPHYDKILHTYFGLWCAALVYYFLYLSGAGRLRGGVKFVIIMLSVLGVAACWEIFEYCASIVFGTDPQAWKGPVSRGENPMTDTMWDIIVAIFGVLLFYVTLFIDKKSNGKLYRGTLTPEPNARLAGGSPACGCGQEGEEGASSPSNA